MEGRDIFTGFGWVGWWKWKLAAAVGVAEGSEAKLGAGGDKQRLEATQIFLALVSGAALVPHIDLGASSPPHLSSRVIGHRS